MSVGGGTPQALQYVDSTGTFTLSALNPGAVWAEPVPTGAVVVNASLVPTSGQSYGTVATTLNPTAGGNTAFIAASRPTLTSNSTPLSGFAAAVYSPNGQNIYAVDPADSTVVMLSAATGGVEQTITDGVAGYFGSAYPTQGLKGVDYVAVSPDGTVVFTGGPGGVDAFSVNATTGQLTYYYTIGTTDLAAYNPDGYETLPLPGSVNGLTAFTLPIAGGQPVEGAYISTSGGFVQWAYEYGYESDEASTSSLANVVAQTAGVSDTEVYPSLTVQQQSVIYALGNGGATLDTIVPFSTSFTNGTPIASVALPVAGTAVATSPNGNFIYVASQSGNAITAIRQTSTILNDPDALTVVQTVTDNTDGVHGLVSPSSLAVTPDGRYLLVGSQANSSLAVFSINQTTGALTYLQVLREGVGGADGLADIAGLLAGASGSTPYALSLGNTASGAGGITPLAIATTPPAPVAYTITFSNIADAGLTLSGNGANTITLAQPPTANVTTESITAGNGGNLINLQALAPHTIVNTGSGADTLNITPAQTGATLTANTGAGNDIINLYSAAANTVFTLSVGDGNDKFYVQGKGIAPSAGIELFADTASPLGDVLTFNPANPNPNTPNFTPTNFSQTTGNLQVTGFGVVKYNSFKQVIVENPPIINAPKVEIKEGQGVVLNATAVAVEGSLVGSLEYDLGNTGVFDVGGGSISAATLADYGIDARGTYTVGVEAIDSDGGTAVAHFNIVIDPVNPVVSVTGAATAQVGSVYTIDLGATLEGTDAITGWEVNWGDGTVQAFGAGVTDVTHTFETPGHFNIEAEAADSYSATGQYPYNASLSITAALPASFTLGQSTTISEGQGLTLVVPSDVPGTPDAYEWSINGRPVGGISAATTLSQTWAQLQTSDGVTQAGTYTVTLSPGYPGSPPGTSLGTTTLVVLNTPPTVVVTPGSAVQIGANATFTLAVTSAASAVQAAGYTVEFNVAFPGGLSSFVFETLAAGGVVTVPAELIPSAVGGYEVLGEVYDTEHGTTSFTDDFNVVAAPGTVVLNGSSLSTEGQTYDLSIDVIGGNTISGYLVNWGDGVTQTLQGGTTQTAAHVFLVNGSLAVDVTAIDTSTTYTAVQGVTVANVAPTLSLSGPASVPQGSPIALDGTITDPGPDDQFSLLINWDDGTQPTRIQLAPGVTAFATPHTYADAGSDTITATVTDDDGAAGTAMLAETVTNVAPSISAIGFTSPTINEGGTATLIGLFTDPGTLDSHTALINWGDGSTSVGTVDAATDTFGGTHVYANNPPGQPDGSFAATATITDNHGASDSAAATETVRNVAPIITAATITPAAVVQGSAITVSATFTDPGTLDTHTALINWGDGDTTPAIVTESQGSGTITATHSFDSAAPPAGQSFYTVTATVTDSDGASMSQVLDPPPIAENLVVSAATINEGGAITLTGTVVDIAPVGGADTVDILWGDGNTAVATINLATPTFDVTHTYLDNPPDQPDGGYRIQVVAANAIGNASTAATGVQVDNVAPGVQHLKLSTSHINEGSSVTLTGTIADPGVLDSETVSIVWGDGGTTAATVNLATRAFSATHTYLDNPPNQPDGSYTIMVTATDNAGGKGSASTSVEVDNVAPHITRLATNAGTVAAGGAVILTGTVVDPGVLDSETVLVNWGDGTSSVASINRTTRVLSASHVYAAGSAGADTGTTITATAIDNSGGSGAAQVVVQVDTPPAPAVLTLQAAATVANTNTQDSAPVTAVAIAQPAQLITLLQTSPITVSSSGDTAPVVSLVFDDDDGSFNIAQSVTTSLIDDYGEDWLMINADPGDQPPSVA